MQSFADWLDARLAERGWNAADLTRASQTPDHPRGIDSGLISRWRKPPPFGTVPTQAHTLSRLARAFGVPEAEVYEAAGLGPKDHSGTLRPPLPVRQRHLDDQYDRWMLIMGPRLGEREADRVFWEPKVREAKLQNDVLERALYARTESALNAAHNAPAGEVKRAGRDDDAPNSLLTLPVGASSRGRQLAEVSR